MDDTDWRVLGEQIAAEHEPNCWGSWCAVLDFIQIWFRFEGD